MMYTTILLAAALQQWERYSAHALAAREGAATLLQECGAWETVPALVTIRMTTWLTRNDRTHSALL